MPPDPIDQAVAAAEPTPEPRSVVQVTLPTGRLVLLNIPRDMSIEEMLALSGYIGSKLPASLAGVSRPRLFVPS